LIFVFVKKYQVGHSISFSINLVLIFEKFRQFGPFC